MDKNQTFSQSLPNRLTFFWRQVPTLHWYWETPSSGSDQSRFYSSSSFSSSFAPLLLHPWWSHRPTVEDRPLTFLRHWWSRHRALFSSHGLAQVKGWDKSPSLLIVFGLSSKTQWLSGLYYADFISFYSPTQLCGGGTTKSNSNELPISVPLSFLFIQLRALLWWFVFGVFC